MLYSEILFSTTLWAYLFATLFYVAYMVFKKNEIGQLATATAIIGLILNTASLIFRYIEAGHAPFSNQFESLVFFAWSIILVYLIFEFKYKIKIMGAFIVCFGFLSIAVASLLPYRYQAIEPLVPALQSYWLHIHVITTFLGYAGFAASFGISIVYLLKSGAGEVNKEGTFFSRFPELIVLDDISYKSIALGFPFLTIGIITGSVWANYAWGSYWSWDPKETWSLITWFIYAAYLHSRVTKSWRGKKSALLSMIGFASVIFTYFGVNFILSGLHAYG
jgi:cytochrome c-type biogenesis protein CcsB